MRRRQVENKIIYPNKGYLCNLLIVDEAVSVIHEVNISLSLILRRQKNRRLLLQILLS